MNRLLKKSVIAVGVTAGLVLGGAGIGTAWATTTMTKPFAGLKAYDKGGPTPVLVAEIDMKTPLGSNTLTRRGSLDKNGESMMTKPLFKDARPTNGRGVYVKIDYWADGDYCYVSGIGVDASKDGGGISVSRACQQGWHQLRGQSSQTMAGTGWFYLPYGFVQARNGTNNTIKADLQVCEDSTAWTADVCADGPRKFGVDFN